MGMNRNSWGPCYHNEHEASNPYDKNVNPEVYRPEDGHAWKESRFPTLRESGKCALCGALGDLHMQAQP